MDDRQFETLFREYGSRVLGFAIRLCGNRSEAEDLVQETFVAAYVGRDSYAGRSRELTWLLGIAIRRWRDGNRRQRPTIADFEVETMAEARCGASFDGEIEDRVTRSISLDRALSALNPSLKESLLLVASQGLTYREAAEVLGEPVGTIKWRVSEGKRQMRELLQREESDDVRKPAR